MFLLGMELSNVHFFEEAERVFVGVGVIHKIRITQIGGKTNPSSALRFLLSPCSWPAFAIKTLGRAFYRAAKRLIVEDDNPQIIHCFVGIVASFVPLVLVGKTRSIR